ncbi:Transcriptional regulator, TetR family (modular protein) [Frankia canadensis]|uniref:Transcriptional regulator, TetR family (Modular protein) n=1 Tax=Frankia canadensis TaxID=1836972 RepID=A0A2I2L0H0_9ACTN|nr:TetR/AcrR family transcriptional regulator [Frankia canadensis]SNQ51405.1 Transcriptional regulator, TetR family (modular protein) [Frankia canadensis]SOU58695.1 Transcriptional regulator, TetR family (modular protein) [Frankia canadensis]
MAKEEPGAATGPDTTLAGSPGTGSDAGPGQGLGAGPGTGPDLGPDAALGAEQAGRPRRGRPRDATIDTRVIAAAVDELAEHGVGGFSVNRVALRAGVAKRGIYARWPDRDDLVLTALGTLAAGLVPPRTGGLRSDLLHLAPFVDAVFLEPRMSVLARCMAELRRFPTLYAAFRRESVDRCAAAIEDAFHDAVLRGEARADLDTDLASSAFLGALMARHAFGARAPSDNRAYHLRLVDFCLAAVRPAPGPAADPPAPVHSL